jgi:hypothetical protein
MAINVVQFLQGLSMNDFIARSAERCDGHADHHRLG